MFKRRNGSKSEKGFTLIELLVVAAIIGILLAIAIPNLIQARLSANEANARKAMQTLRDASGEFFEQDQDNNGVRDYTDLIGGVPASGAVDGSLRCPDADATVACNEADALVDGSFFEALPSTGDGAPAGTADCTNGKAGYCVGWTGDNTASDIAGASWSDPPVAGSILQSDFGWEASMLTPTKSGRRDFGVWGDGVIRCTPTTLDSSVNGNFSATRDGTGGTPSEACD